MHRSLRETPSSHGCLRRGIQSVVFTSVLLGLAACGGGGGGGGGSNNPPPAPPATNAPPTVNAGADTSITLPTATVTLAGSATDDGPAASLTYKWTGAGPAAVTFATDTAAGTDATFTAAGAYTLTLTVNDGTQSASDTVAVTVNAAPPAALIWPADDVNETDPLHGWAKVVDAASVGMTQSGLDTAATFAQGVPDTVIDPISGTKAGGAGMIVRHGQLVHSWGDIDKKQEMKSVTKSMGGIVLGLAIDANKLTLASKGVDFIPTFGTPPDTNASLGSDVITLAQLATHTSGFAKDGGFQAIEAPPGTVWKYSDGGLNWLADVLTTVYQEDLKTLADAQVWQVLGLNKVGTIGDDVFWRTNAKRPPTRNGGTLQYRELASGIEANVNAMARVGLLFLRKGKWKDTQVLSEAFVTRVQTPLNSGLTSPAGFPGAATDYGVLWWTNKSGLMPNVPQDTFWAWGLGEELIVVIPSLDLVITRNGFQDSAPSTGRIWNDREWDGDIHVLEGFLNPIVAATTP
jgi:CubicO group peptidase (beta-lactamase class C family)